jgi:hypothetical protein
MISRKPTLKWRQHLDEFEDQEIFTEKGIADVERLLEAFELGLQNVDTGDREKILDAVKQVVLNLNAASKRHPGMIETGEREDLWEFISAAALDAGLEIPFGEDITLPWREW